MKEGGDHLPKIQRTTNRESTNKSKNKLASRLYRNSSLNRINANTTMLNSSITGVEPSFLNCSNGQNGSMSQLVASISLRKLRNKNDSEPYLQISNGKLLISKSRSHLQESFSREKPKTNPKKMFRKLDKLQHSPYSPENKILPDELMDYTVQEEPVIEPKAIKKSTLASPRDRDKSSKMTSYYQDKQDLFPEDFMQLLHQDKNIKNQFCYLKKMQHPYDLKIVPFHKNFDEREVNQNPPGEYPKEYITISSRGVTYFSQQQPRFVPLDQWRRQAVYFRKIIKLDFFKNFKIIKNFSNWKKYLRKSAMKSTMEKLKQKLFHNDKYLRSSLLQVRKICYIMETDVSYCRIDDCQKVCTHREFKAAQQVFIQNQFERRISQLQENIKEVLIHNMSESMKQFKEQNKISSSSEGKGMPLLIGDEKNLEMPYTKEATLRTQQQKFQKFIKLIDLLITHSKVNMMSESTLVLSKKITEENESYEHQVIDSNYDNIFKGKQYLQCTLSLSPSKSSLLLEPSYEQLVGLFQDIVNRSVVRLCRNHKRINTDIDILSVIYGNPKDFPKQNQVQGLKVIMTSDGRQQQMLKLIMGALEVSYGYILKYVEQFQKFAIINSQNIEKKKEIDSFQPKDYEMIKNLIQKWHRERDQISKISKEHDGPIFQLNLKQFKEEAEKTTNDCLVKIKMVIPQIFQDSIRKLQNCLTQALSQVQQQPIGVEDLIIFNQNKSKISIDIEDYSDKMLEISCLQILMKNLSPTEPPTYKKYQKQIKQLQFSLTTLRKKLDQADMNNKTYQTRAQQIVKQLVPRNKARLMETYTKIQIASREQKDVNQMVGVVEKRKADLTEIIQQFQNIRTYQRFLNLEQSDRTELENFITFFEYFSTLWSTAYNFNQQHTKILQTPWGSITPSQLNSNLQQYITTLISLQKHLQTTKQKDTIFQFSAHDKKIISSVLGKIQRVRPLVQVIQYLGDEALGEKQMKEIKTQLEERNPQLVRILNQNKMETLVKELQESGASAQLDMIKGVASRAKKSHKVSKKMEAISNFFKKQSGIFRILTERFNSQIDQILNEVDQKIIMANFVQEQSQTGQRDRLKVQKQNLEKLKEILTLWDQYEKHVQYFEPIYTSMDWKNTPEGKNFMLATQQNWKKTYKNFKDSNLSKILSAQRIIPSLRQSNQVLQSLYPSMRTYFNSKKMQSCRLSFLSDQQIVRIHEQSKDFKGFSSYISKLFPCIKELVIKQQDQYQFDVINNDGEVLPIRIGRISNFQVDDMIKAIEQGIKNGIKQNLKTCHASFDSEQFNKIQWIKKNLLQSLIFVTGVYFTRIMQEDYMSNQAEDIEKLYNYHISQIQSMKNLIREEKDSLTIKKLTVLLTQSVSLRDVIRNVTNSEALSKDSYVWLRQVRQYYNIQSAYTEYLNTPLSYGYQFVNLSTNPLLLLTLNEKAILQIVNTILLCTTVPIVSKSYLAQIAMFNAKPYNQINFVSGKQVFMIQSAVLGTWLLGSFTDLSLPKDISQQQISFVAKIIQQAQFMTTLKDPYIFGLKNSNLNKESGIAIVCPSLWGSPVLKELKIDYRVLNFPKFSWQAFIELLLEVHCISLPYISKKLCTVIQYMEKALPQIVLSRRQVRIWFEQIQEKSTETDIARLFLENLKNKDMSVAHRKFLFKLFNEAFGLSYTQQLKSSKTIRDYVGSVEEIRKIMNILKDRKVCVIAGEGSQFKQLIVESICGKNSINKSLYIRKQNLPNLLGHYENGKWIQGLLTEIICSRKQNYILLIGQCSNTILSLLEKLDGVNKDTGPVILDNGQKLFLSESQKIVLLSETAPNVQLPPTKVKVHRIASKSNIDETFDYLFSQKVDPLSGKTLEQKHFGSNQDLFVSIRNMYLNNVDKFSTTLKTIGYRNEYLQSQLILGRFATIFNAALSTDTENICTENPKMMDKLYLWTLFWAIYSSLPKRCTQKLEKLFDTIKIQCDKTQSMSETKFLISESNQTISKFIKSVKKFQTPLNNQLVINSELEAKTQLILLLITQNVHINLIGEKGSGKSSYIDYLDYTFKGKDYSTVQTHITNKMTVDGFLQQIGKIYVQYLPNKLQHRYRVCSVTGKKLIVFVDNFNLIEQNSQLFDFFRTALSYSYTYDSQRSCKKQLQNIVFVCSSTDSFEPISSTHSFSIRNLFPIFVNPVELTDIMESYHSVLENLDEEHKTLCTKLINSSGSLHMFINNLIFTQNHIDKEILGNCIPIWLVKEIISKCFNNSITSAQLISLWKYLCRNQYINSALASEYEDEIEHEINNLAELIVKVNEDEDQCIKIEKETIDTLMKQIPLLLFQHNDSEYYIFLAYLIRSQQVQHLLSYQRNTPQYLKAVAISKICEKLQTNFIHLKKGDNLNDIKNIQNVVIYVYIDNPTFLEEVVCLVLKERTNTQINFVIDLQSQSLFQQCQRFYPGLIGVVSIFGKKPLESYQKPQIAQQKVLTQLFTQMNINMDSKQLYEIHVQIWQIWDSVSIEIEKQLNEKKEKNNFAYNGFDTIIQDMKNSQNQIAQLRIQVNTLSQQQDNLLKKKNELVQNLTNMKKNQQQTSQQSRDQLNKQITLVDSALKKSKSSKNQKIESISKLKQSLKQKQQTLGLLQQFYDSSVILQKALGQITQNQNFILFGCLSTLLSLCQKVCTKCTQLSEKIDAIFLENFGATLIQIWEGFSGKQGMIQKFSGIKIDSKIKAIVSKYFGTEDINLEYSQKQQFQKKLLQKLSIENGTDYSNELRGLKAESTRLKTQYNLLQSRIRQKAQCQNFTTLSHSQLSELKQLGEAKAAIHMRIQTNAQKQKNIRETIQNKFIEVVKNSVELITYLQLISKIYTYFLFDSQRFVDVVVKSLVYIALDQDKVTKSMKIIPELKVEQTNNRIIGKVAKIVCMALHAYDALIAYFLLSCFIERKNQKLSDSHLQTIIKKIKGKNVEIELPQPLSKILGSLTPGKPSAIPQLIEYSDSVLGLSFKSLLPWDEGYIHRCVTLQKQYIGFNNEQICKKVFITFCSPTSFSFKNIDKQLRRYIEPQQTIFYVSTLEVLEHRIQMMEKTASNMQGWIVLVNEFRSQNLNKTIQFVKQSKNYRLMLVFENAQKFNKVKDQLIPSNYFQLSLYDKTKNICYKMQRIIAKNQIEKAPQINRLIKIICFDQIFEMCLGFHNPIFVSTPYSYRILENLIKINPKLTARDVALFGLDFFYSLESQKHRFFFRQAKKLSKLQVLPEIFDDGSIPSSYEYISSTYEQLKPKMSKEQRLKTFLDSILPLEQSKLIPTDLLYSFPFSSMASQSIQNNIPQYKPPPPRSQMFRLLESILQQVPILSKEQPSQKPLPLHLHLLKTSKQNQRKKYQNLMTFFKYIKKLLEFKKYFGERNLRKFEILGDGQDVVKDMLKREKSIQMLQKVLESKGVIHLQSCLQLVSQPMQFLYVYMFEEHLPSKVDWNHFELWMKIMPQKQKQKQNSEKNEQTQLSPALMHNARFQPHKCFIQQLQNNSFSKLHTISLHLGKPEAQHHSLKVPVMSGGKKICDVGVVSKAKVLGFWGKDVWVEIGEKINQQNL